MSLGESYQAKPIICCPKWIATTTRGYQQTLNAKIKYARLQLECIEIPWMMLLWNLSIFAGIELYLWFQTLLWVWISFLVLYVDEAWYGAPLFWGWMGFLNLERNVEERKWFRHGWTWGVARYRAAISNDRVTSYMLLEWIWNRLNSLFLRVETTCRGSSVPSRNILHWERELGFVMVFMHGSR